MLEGISRLTILDICDELSIQKQVRPITKEEFMEADEIFLSTSSGGVVPITKVNNRIFSNNAPGEMTNKILKCYWNWTEKSDLRIEIDYNEKKVEANHTVKSKFSKILNRLILMTLIVAIILILYVIYNDYPELLSL